MERNLEDAESNVIAYGTVPYCMANKGTMLCLNANKNGTKSVSMQVRVDEGLLARRGVPQTHLPAASGTSRQQPLAHVQPGNETRCYLWP